jgi:hypothetical protein
MFDSVIFTITSNTIYKELEITYEIITKQKRKKKKTQIYIFLEKKEVSSYIPIGQNVFK